MNIKKKLIIMGVCIVIVIAVLTANVIRRIKLGEDNHVDEEVTVKENIITRAEAYRLLSYLEYDKAGREALKMDINYAYKDMSGWYDSYVNAAWKMGLIEGSITVSPNEALTIGQGKTLIDRLITKNPRLQGVYVDLSFDFLNADEEMLIPQFLELYKALLEMIPEDERMTKNEVLFILDREVNEDGKDRIVADIGRYYYENSRDYEKFFTTVSDRSYDRLTGEEFLTRFNNKGIEVLTCGNEIVYISKIHREKILLHNVWIKQGKGSNVDAYINGVHKELQTQFKLSQDFEKVIGNISVENEKIVAISVKPDRIQGKVLLSGEDFIEIEGYGRIPLEEDYKIYKIYGELSMERTNGILVGYNTTDFVVSGGKISAALIRESIKAENIRVLINTSGFKNIYHDKVEIGATSDYVIKIGEDETAYTAEETITLQPGDKMLSEGRVIIEPVSEEGKIKLLSIERSTGVPRYRGRIEIAQGDKGLLIVNELPLEEYLYAVIPSEMPTYYGLEPLKVQAVCARSYAYRHLIANSLSGYGAHVDDSVSYQVYNNIEENEDSILAVKDTYGKVVEYEGEVITAYYFSTSCGHTTSVEHVWANGIATPYLSGRLLNVEGDDSQDVLSEQRSLYSDLIKEDNFRSFILDQDFDTYDSAFSWYRWYVTIDTADIRSNLDEKLAGRYRANPDLILTLVSGDQSANDSVYESLPVETVGDIVDIFVGTRGTGGIIFELIIEGTERTIKVQTEYNIRALLSPSKDTVYRQDENGVDNLSLLPSAFFFIDQNSENGKLESISLTGGGYGHGVGMSQNGVKSLSDAGRKYEEIIKYFYKGTDMGFIY
ncbi:MAG: SpoIID/LytB domain-containing protein [Anaerolineaceae bacterium]|nr:MAG: SpoIID/LytB domain-containing protein [Anaerolineaceae bacterium]